MDWYAGHQAQSGEFESTWDVWEKTRWLAGINGARCTTALKVEPRLEFQRPDDVHVFGYTADRRDADRAKRLPGQLPGADHPARLSSTLLDQRSLPSHDREGRHSSAADVCHGLSEQQLHPVREGYQPAYWALVRKNFPAEFNRMAKLSRELDVRLCRIKGERSFIDEIPPDHPTTRPDPAFV